MWITTHGETSIIQGLHMFIRRQGVKVRDQARVRSMKSCTALFNAALPLMFTFQFCVIWKLWQEPALEHVVMVIALCWESLAVMLWTDHLLATLPVYIPTLKSVSPLISSVSIFGVFLSPSFYTSSRFTPPSSFFSVTIRYLLSPQSLSFSLSLWHKHCLHFHTLHHILTQTGARSPRLVSTCLPRRRSPSESSLSSRPSRAYDNWRFMGWKSEPTL